MLSSFCKGDVEWHLQFCEEGDEPLNWPWWRIWERGNLRKELSSLVSMQGDLFQWIPEKGLQRLQGGVFEMVIK